MQFYIIHFPMCQQGHSADLPQCKGSESGLKTDVLALYIHGSIYIGNRGQVKVVLVLGSVGTMKILLQGPVRPQYWFLGTQLLRSGPAHVGRNVPRTDSEIAARHYLTLPMSRQ